MSGTVVVLSFIVVGLIIFGALTKKDVIDANDEIEKLNEKLKVSLAMQANTGNAMKNIELLTLSSTDNVIAQLLDYHKTRLTDQQLEIVKIYYAGLKGVILKADDAVNSLLSKLTDVKMFSEGCATLNMVPNSGDAFATMIKERYFENSAEYNSCEWENNGKSYNIKLPLSYKAPPNFRCQVQKYPEWDKINPSLYNKEIVNAIVQFIKDIVFISENACSEFAKNGYSADMAKKYITMFKKEYERTKNYMVIYLNRPIEKLATHQLEN